MRAVKCSGGQVSERSPVFLIDAATRNPVPAVLVDEVSDDGLRAADQSWVRIRYEAALDAIGSGARPARHTHWEWQDKTGPGRAGRHILGVEHDGEMQGLVALCLDKKCRLPVQMGLPLVYVDYIETAPWNLKRYTQQPRFRGCGPHLIGAAVGLSFKRGWAGRLVCGLTEMPPDVAYHDMRYFEMTEAQAKVFQEKGGDMT